MLDDIGYYGRLLLRRLHWIILFAVIGTGAGLWLALTMPPLYEASARLIVESEQIPDELAASTVRTAATEQIQIIEQRILTREVLLEMANRLNIYADQPRLPASDKVDDLRDRISILVQGGGSRATLVTVSFRAPEGQMAAQVTNEIVTLILRENVSMRTTVAGQTLEFFIQEVDRLDQEMARLSGRILAFKEENLEALPDSLDFRRSQQAAAQERLVQIDRTIDTLSDRRERLVELFAETGELPVSDERNLSFEEQQLVQLRREYASSVAVLSQDNPKIAVLRARISALETTVAEQQVGREAASAGEEGTAAPPTQLDIQLADIDSQLSLLGSRREEIEARLAELSSTIQNTPGNAVTLETMERDYANLRAQYNQAVASRARAETGDMIEALSKGQRISLVEQAIAPREPVSPNRPLLAGAGVGAGLGAGIALFVLLELINGAVRRPSEITAKLGIATLATVPYIRTRRELRNRRLALLGSTAGVALACVGALWIVDTQVLPVEQVIQRIKEQVEAARAVL